MYCLSKEEIFTIVDEIRDRFIFVCQQTESYAFSIQDKTIRRWKFEGKISSNVVSCDFYVPNFDDGALRPHPFVFGRIELAIDKGADYDTVLQNSLEDPLLQPDFNAIDILRRQISSGRRISNEMRTVLKMAESYFNRTLKRTDAYGKTPSNPVESWQQFASELHHTMENKSIDWQQVAYCRLNNVKSMSELLSLIQEFGPDCIVYKLTLSTACPQCKALYRNEDGTPRKFKAVEMLAYGTNSGRKRMPVKCGRVISVTRRDGHETWKPVAGIVHPWCSCSPPRLFTGYEPWAKKGNGQ